MKLQEDGTPTAMFARVGWSTNQGQILDFVPTVSGMTAHGTSTLGDGIPRAHFNCKHKFYVEGYGAQWRKNTRLYRHHFCYCHAAKPVVQNP